MKVKEIRTVGILGGSFNPPHMGHLTMAEEAHKRLGLDEVWFLVSPQNPLKAKEGMAPFDVRFALCQDMAEGISWLRVSDFEQNTPTQFTLDTLRALKRAYPDVQFVWLMGSDNLATIHTWQSWRQIFLEFPLCVLYRETAAHAAITAPAAHHFRHARVAETAPLGAAPQWRLLHVTPHAGEATRIRRQIKEGKTPSYLTEKQRKRLATEKNLW